MSPVTTAADRPSLARWALGGGALFQYFDFRYTFFFSGHTAYPFPAFLLARRPWVRWTCPGFALMPAASVLLSRRHYSVDVAGAFLITFAVAGLARRSWRLLPR